VKRIRALQALGSLAFAFLLSAAHAAPGPEVVNDLQAWQGITLRTSLGPGHRILAYMEAQPREGNLDGSGSQKDDFSALLLRPALGYRVNRHVSIWQGYAWYSFFTPTSFHENRLFQQLLIENNFKKLSMVNRTRLEERFIEGRNRTAVRLRHMLRLAYPIGKSKKWSIVGYDEFFVNLNSVNPNPSVGFDQNRAFLGVNRKFNTYVNAELGYQNQYVGVDNPFPDRINHIILFTININR